MGKKLSVLFTSLTILLFGFSLTGSPVLAQGGAGTLTLSPATGTGSTFSVQVLLDTGTEATVETDLAINFDATKLRLDSVDFGTLYPENIQSVDNDAGMLSTFSYVSTGSYTGAGVLATLNFTGISNGTAAVTIECTPSATNESNIIPQQSTGDILNCQQIVNGSYTVNLTGGGTTTTVTPTVSIAAASPTPTIRTTISPTPTRILEVGGGNLTPTPTPVEQLLNSGASTTTVVITMVGATMLLGSLLLFVW